MSLLSPSSQKTLLALARKSIDDALSRRKTGAAAQPDEPELRGKAGAFVTLHKNGALRGCIGTFEARDELVETIARMARAAAFEDPRFPAVAAEELPLLELEISVLTPMKPVEDVEEIEVGRHGLYVVQGSRRGVLLPQVAVSYVWDREMFLAQTCVKAGLPPDAWRHGAKIYSFEAQVFGEKG